MTNKYKETSKKLNEIRMRNEILFRMAISHLMDVGIRHLTDENVKYTCEEIMKGDDSNSFMTNEFQCDIVRTAAELAKVDPVHLLVYISKNVKYEV